MVALSLESFQSGKFEIFQSLFLVCEEKLTYDEDFEYFTYFIVIGYSIQVKEFLTHNSIWTEHLKPNIVAHNPLQRRFQSVVGMGGFYSLLTAQDGYSVVARISFYKFCEDVDAKTLGLFAHFVDFCFRLRLCDEAQVQYHTILCTLPLYKVLICRIVFII